MLSYTLRYSIVALMLMIPRGGVACPTGTQWIERTIAEGIVQGCALLYYSTADAYQPQGWWWRGEVTIESPSGITLSKYVSNEKGIEGERTDWYESGKKKRVSFYVRGVLHGKYTEWYETGRVHLDGTYDSGVKSGCWVEYYESGKRSEQLCSSMPNDDTFKYEEWNEQGTLIAEGLLRKDLRDGWWKEYYSDSRLKSQGIYKMGIKSGKWEYIDMDGSIMVVNEGDKQEN